MPGSDQQRWRYNRSQKLAKVREERGLSLSYAAIKIGVRRQTLRAWENSDQTPQQKIQRARVLRYLWHDLGLRDQPQRFYELWHKLAIEIWEWDEIEADEARKYLADQQKLPLISAAAPPATSAGDRQTRPDQRPQASQIPLQYPPRTENFSGRADELAGLRRDLQPDRSITLCGPGGVGKTALVYETIRQLDTQHQLLDRFPDGVVFYSFYGRSDIALAFEHIVRSFDETAPDTSANAARRILVDKQALIILDGTEEAADLRGVLAVLGKCGRLMTSRRRQDAAGDLRNVRPLPQNSALQLLRTWAETQIDQRIAMAICELVDGLPLAVRLAGQYLRNDPQAAVDYLAWLQKETLEALHRGEHRLDSVPILIERSLTQVRPESLRVLAVAGQLALAPFRREPVVAALEGKPGQVRPGIDDLINFGLLMPVGQRYQVSHALIHTYARERLPAEAEVIGRLVDYYETFTREQNALGVEGYGRLTTERSHLMQILANAVEQQDVATMQILPAVLDDYLTKQGHWTERVLALQAGLQAAQIVGDRQVQGFWLGNLGSAYSDLGQVEVAIEYYDQALTMSRQTGDRRSENEQLGNLGNAYRFLGQVELAIDYYEQALAISRKIGDRRSEGVSLGTLGTAYHSLGQVERALEYYQQTLAIAREIDDPYNEATALGNLGNAYRLLGQIELAIGYYEQALTIAREMGDRRSESIWLGNLGPSYSDLGQVERAVDHYEQALAISREIGHRHSEGVWLDNLGTSYHSIGQVEQAIDYFEQALSIAREIGDRHGESNRLGNLGGAYYDLGRVEQAIDYFKQALSIAREIGDRRSESVNLDNLGMTYHSLGQVELASDYYEQALSISREIGDRRSESNQLSGLGTAYYDLGQIEQAIEYYQQALAISHEIGDRRSESDGLTNLGAAYHKLGQIEQAIEFYKKVVELEPHLPSAYDNLAEAHLDLGQLDEAIRYCQRRVEIRGDTALEAHICLGVIACYRGQESRARRHFQTALTLSDAAVNIQLQTPATILENKAVALLGLGRERAAITTLQEALAHRQPSETFRAARYDLLAAAPKPPSGIAKIRDILDSMLGS